MREVRNYRLESLAAWKGLRQRGLSIDDSLNEIKHGKYGLGLVVDALRDAEGMTTETALLLLEKRGDYKDF